MRLGCSTADSRRAFFHTVLSVATAAVLAACGPGDRGPDGSRRSFESPRRVVLVTLDTLRSDHLSFHGYPRNTTPFLARLAERSADFENALAVGSITNPTHVSIFTGLHLAQHKVRMNQERRFAAAIRSLPQSFRERGYATAAFVSVPFLRILERGFGRFEGPPSGVARSDGVQTVDRALDWLDGRAADARLFLWVHLYDAHGPFRIRPEFEAQLALPDGGAALQRHWIEVQGKEFRSPDGKLRERALFDLNDRYDHGVALVDSLVERLYTGVERRGLLSESLWVIVADHGEGLRSHGYVPHARYVYQEQLRVPLLVHHPDGALRSGRLPDLVSQTDLFPTLLDVIGVSGPTQPVRSRGRSLLPLLAGEVPTLPRPEAFSERGWTRRGVPQGWTRGPHYALQDLRHKYIVDEGGSDEFFDLAPDPNERVNLAGRGTALEQAWRERTHAFRARLAAEAAAVEGAESSEEFVDALRELGYVE